MKTFVVFFILSISAFSAPWDPPNASELKIRQTWADYYKKKGYDFDIQKMSASDMDKAFRAAEFRKKLDAGKKVQEEEAARRRIAAEAARKSKAAADKLEQERAFAALTPEERELIKLDTEANKLYQIFFKDPSAVNHGRWSEASEKALKLKRKLYPSTYHSSSGRSTTLDDVIEKLDDINDKLE